VKKSTIQDAQEGLFAARDVKAGIILDLPQSSFLFSRDSFPGTIIAMYNGIRIELVKAEARGWDYNANLICLNDFRYSFS
jgi:hypothetical protein